jgi:hypothetical protein
MHRAAITESLQILKHYKYSIQKIQGVKNLFNKDRSHELSFRQEQIPNMRSDSQDAIYNYLHANQPSAVPTNVHTSTTTKRELMLNALAPLTTAVTRGVARPKVEDRAGGTDQRVRAFSSAQERINKA